MIQKLNQVSDISEYTESNIAQPTQIISEEVTKKVKPDKQLKEMLVKLNQVILEETEDYQDLVEIANTHKIAGGIRIDNYEIIKEKSEDSYIPVYHVYGKAGANKYLMFESLGTYHAAQSIVMCLNRGDAADSNRIQQILEVDTQFFSAFNEVYMFKSRYEKTGNILYENRYDQSKVRLENVKNQLKRLTETILTK